MCLIACVGGVLRIIYKTVARNNYIQKQEKRSNHRSVHKQH